MDGPRRFLPGQLELGPGRGGVAGATPHAVKFPSEGQGGVQPSERWAPQTEETLKSWRDNQVTNRQTELETDPTPARRHMPQRLRGAGGQTGCVQRPVFHDNMTMTVSATSPWAPPTPAAATSPESGTLLQPLSNSRPKVSQTPFTSA